MGQTYIYQTVVPSPILSQNADVNRSLPKIVIWVHHNKRLKLLFRLQVPNLRKYLQPWLCFFSKSAHIFKRYSFWLPVHNLIVSGDFQNRVILRFRSDAVGKICQTDKAVLLLDDSMWAKSARKEKRIIMSNCCSVSKSQT